MVYGLGFMFRVNVLVCRVKGLGFMAYGLEIRVYGLGFRV